MSKRLLLGSGGFRTPERVHLLTTAMREFFGPVSRLLFVPYALADHDAYLSLLHERGLHAGYELVGLHRETDVGRAVREAEGIFVGGGNTFRLLDTLHRLGLIPLIRERVAGGLPYLGISAGTNVACPTIKTSNDMPIVQPPSFEALSLVPFQVNPHYVSGHFHVKEGDQYVEHFGETRDERIKEYHELNELPVVGLWEAGLLHIDSHGTRLSGAPARIFRKGSSAIDVEPGRRLDSWLGI